MIGLPRFAMRSRPSPPSRRPRFATLIGQQPADPRLGGAPGRLHARRARQRARYPADRPVLVRGVGLPERRGRLRGEQRRHERAGLVDQLRSNQTDPRCKFARLAAEQQRAAGLFHDRLVQRRSRPDHLDGFARSLGLGAERAREPCPSSSMKSPNIAFPCRGRLFPAIDTDRMM